MDRASARAMANFGFKELAVVDPYEPVWRETRSAVEAEDVVKNARLFSSLAEAVADCHLVLGTTCGKNRVPERETVLLPDIGKFLEKRTGKIAVVFGPEKTGLGNEHLLLCHAFLTVPTGKAVPSMNLAQAVAVCCYELSKLSRAARVSKRPAQSGLPVAGEIELVVAELCALLDSAGVKGRFVGDVRRAHIRYILQKLPLSRQELFYIKKTAGAIVPLIGKK